MSRLVHISLQASSNVSWLLPLCDVTISNLLGFSCCNSRYAFQVPLRLCQSCCIGCQVVVHSPAHQSTIPWGLWLSISTEPLTVHWTFVVLNGMVASPPSPSPEERYLPPTAPTPSPEAGSPKSQTAEEQAIRLPCEPYSNAEVLSIAQIMTHAYVTKCKLQSHPASMSTTKQGVWGVTI